jgi:hypothetical protein
MGSKERPLLFERSYKDLADRYGRHIATPWQRTIAGAQRVVMVV